MLLKAGLPYEIFKECIDDEIYEYAYIIAEIEKQEEEKRKRNNG